jgi:putative redox protein
MIHELKTTWQGKMAFDSDVDNHTVRLDTGGRFGDDSGPGPKKLLLASLAGCTGMDVVSLLHKMRVPFNAFDIAIEADITEEHPMVYTEIRLTYRLSGTGDNNQKVEKAIELSQEKYCGVSAMLRKNCPINYTIEYID